MAMTALTLTGCGAKETQTDDQTTTDSIVSGTEGTDEETGEDTGSNSELAAMTALELTKIMGNGINLGNTMESGNRATLGTDAAINLYETNWGMPETTQEMVQGMKDAGFDTLRIPVAWTCAINYENGDYTIRKEFIGRIEEIVNYALNADMFVIVNDHWDNQWWGRFGDADQSVRDGAMTLYTEMWKGIATHFANYDERLIFESANEELGDRLNDDWKDLGGKQTGTLNDDEKYALTNTINQAFVDTVRAAGGNNDHRFLLIAGFNTDINRTGDDRFKMPVDTAKDKLLLSVHYYDPSNYCIFGSTDNWGVKADYVNMNESLAKMKKFTDAGYGVVIGECGVLYEGSSSELRPNHLLYIENFINNCDLYGLVPVLWDCNSVYNRKECRIENKELARLYTKYSYEYQQDVSDEDLKAKAQANIDKATDSAVEVVVEDGTAWMMFASSDWAISYANGDDHPTGGTDGIAATEVVLTGEGTYTVGLDFTGTWATEANSMVFCAIGVLNGENLFPGYVISVKEVLINGEPYAFHGENYTTSDDGNCTRSNLYNGWVTSMPGEARTAGDIANADSTGIIVPEEVGMISTIEVTFDFMPGK